MNNKIKNKIQRLLALANDKNDEESMTALVKAQELMLLHNIGEQEIFNYKQNQNTGIVSNMVIYRGKPRKWLYRLASIIAKNFRVKYYYQEGTPIELHFLGLESDTQIAHITFEYARGSINYCSKEFMKRPEIKRKRKRKWQLKQDYIEGFLTGLSKVFSSQVLTNGYEICLQLPEIVNKEIEGLGLVTGDSKEHKIKDYEAFSLGFKEGVNFKNKELLDY